MKILNTIKFYIEKRRKIQNEKTKWQSINLATIENLGITLLDREYISFVIALNCRLLKFLCFNFFWQLDPDFEPDIVQGDLKPTMVNGAPESGNETTDTTTNCSQPANYAVSPWELSLRLHELIESRLETRIKELEIALGDSQNRVPVQGSQSIVSERRFFAYSETESSSTHQSPTCICDEHDKREEGPSTKNFASSYLDAYKESNGVFLRVTDKDQEKEDGEYDSISHHGVIMEEDRSVTLVQDMPQIWDKQRSTSFMSNEDSMSEEEGSDESEMLLIKQIVERRKSGSSFNLKID